MTEQQIQSKRIKQLEAEGYYVIKIIKANKNGLPDILALHPDKGVLFSEVKTPEGRLSKDSIHLNTLDGMITNSTPSKYFTTESIFL